MELRNTGNDDSETVFPNGEREQVLHDNNNLPQLRERLSIAALLGSWAGTRKEPGSILGVDSPARSALVWRVEPHHDFGRGCPSLTDQMLPIKLAIVGYPDIYMCR
jgi:hypothetical protein